MNGQAEHLGDVFPSITIMFWGQKHFLQFILNSGVQ